MGEHSCMNTEKNFKTKWFIIFFVVLPVLLAPVLFEALPNIAILWIQRWQKIAAAVAFFFAVLQFIKVRKIPVYVWLFGFLELWILAVTYFKQGPLFAYSFLMDYAIRIGTITLVFFAFSDEPDSLISAFLAVFELLILANVASQLICGETGIFIGTGYIDPQFSLGHKNQFIGYVYPAICLALYRLYKGCGTAAKVNAWLVISASVATVFLSDSSCNKAGLALSILLFILYAVPFFRRVLSAPVTFSAAILADVLLVVLRVSDNVPFIANFIETVLHRQITFTGRTTIWDNFLQLMPGNWLTGLGYAPGTMIAHKSWFVPHAHNQYYEMLSEGGLVALAIFLSIFVLIAVQLTKYRDKKASAVLTAAMTGLLFVFICDPIFPPVYVLYFLALNIDTLHE